MQTRQDPTDITLEHAQGPEYCQWPSNQSSDGIVLRVLENHLREKSGSACRVDVYCYEGFYPGELRLCETLTTASEVVKMHQSRVVCSETNVPKKTTRLI
jgi:hypothetical protein